MRILILILIIFTSCSRKDIYDDLLDKTKRENPILSKYDWKIVNAWAEDSTTTIEAHAAVKDTAFYLDVVSFKKILESTVVDSTVVNLFYKTYKIDNLIYCLSLSLDGDSLYLFRYRADDEYQAKDFIFGEYSYYFESGALNDEQSKYYLIHKDSLRKIKGNDLPILPKYFQAKTDSTSQLN